ncbi:cold shock domain-containing protein [Arthrobacter glacialis]|uniref:Cold-shock protein n=1 Tax=Arthrobacter glacialis TaxID=1664 RepID=A0A2S4A1F5_ARTGL|nr:cold shock domain-containing protein [Arthrobacter glacialis]POH61031.1 cold-shock protein [Arthrobacter glacialis]POH75129.1 cold-shock protein [Arthrobacter glacialis]
METLGTVRIWHDEEGWGVIDSEPTPGGCWAHFSHIAVPGYASLKNGQAVILEWEAADQDGFTFRATRLWPAGAVPITNEPTPADGPYSSSLSITFEG